MRARPLLTIASLLVAAPMVSGCDVLAVLILSPFFPGQPLPPPDDLVCPTDVAAIDPSTLPPLPSPDQINVELPELGASCDSWC